MLLRASYPSVLVHVLTRLGDTMAPLALVSVGLQLRPRALSGRLRIRRWACCAAQARPRV